MNKQEIIDLYVNFLAGEGYRAQVEHDMAVSFKREGKSYVLMIDEDDLTLFQILYPVRNDLSDERLQKMALAAANEATATTKVVKVSIYEDAAIASIQMFVSPPEAFTPVFERCLMALQAGVAKFEVQFALKIMASGN